LRLRVNHYQVLGISIGADTQVIRRAYRRLALALHPDRAGDEFTAAFQKVAAAYEILSDPVKRARYDDRLARTAPRATKRAPSTKATPRELMARVSGPLRSLIASGILRRIDAESFELYLTRDEAEAGGHIAISTSAPNQFQHWITVAPGTVTGDTLTSIIRVGESRSVLRLILRVY
jgi:curved DNA-binding protein CbpA